MTRLMTHLLFRNRLNLFYLLAFAPVILILYSAYLLRGDFVTWIIPFYAFVLLYIKRDKLSTFSGAHFFPRVVGLALVFFSFFVYYVVVRFFPPAQFYGEANYTIFLIGLFLAFFSVRALREAIAPSILILGASAIPFLGQGLEASLEPVIPFFVQIMAFILALLRIPATTIDPTTFLITPLDSSVVLVGVAPACLGMYSVSTFSILIIVTLLEESSSLRTKLFWSILGIVGTFFVNIIRVSFIFVVIYYFGYENWPVIHNPLGYVLFLAWLGVFFLIFSQREKIERRIESLRLKTQRIRGVKGANQRLEMILANLGYFFSPLSLEKKFNLWLFSWLVF